MDNRTILLKTKLRLNKLASNDFDNLEDYHVIEAFCKGQSDWCRRVLRGINITKDGDEQSTSRIDDLQVLLKETPPTLPLVNKQIFWEADKPTDYLRYKRFSLDATSECCTEPRKMTVYLAEEGNQPELIRNVNTRPSFDWAETFATFVGNKIRIYTNNEFTPINFKLMYYRQPPKIQIAGVANPYDGTISTQDVPCIFNDDLIEVFIEEAGTILAGDIESILQMQRNRQNTDTNN